MPVIIDGTLGVNAAAVTTTNWTPTNIATGGNTTLGDASADTVTINAGNTTFTSTGARILGDFSNATLSNRVSFQSNVTNGVTYIHALPNGTGSNAGFVAFGGSDPTNAAFADISNNGVEGRLRSSATGTATTLPLALYVGTTRAMQITANGGSVSIGSTASTGNPSLQVWQGYNNYGIEVMAATSGTNSGVASFRLLNSANTIERLGLYGESDTVSSVRAQSNLLLNTGGIERVRIDSTGNVGIGTASPLKQFDQLNNANSTGYVDMFSVRVGNNTDASNYSRLWMGQVTTNNMFIEAANQANAKGALHLQPYGGKVGVNTQAIVPTQALDVGGTIFHRADGSYTTYGTVNFTKGVHSGTTAGVLATISGYGTQTMVVAVVEWCGIYDWAGTDLGQAIIVSSVRRSNIDTSWTTISNSTPTYSRNGTGVTKPSIYWSNGSLMYDYGGSNEGILTVRITYKECSITTYPSI